MRRPHDSGNAVLKAELDRHIARAADGDAFNDLLHQPGRKGLVLFCRSQLVGQGGTVFHPGIQCILLNLKLPDLLDRRLNPSTIILLQLQILRLGEHPGDEILIQAIRLNELSPQLQQMVDDKKIAMTPAVEISYLKPKEQELLVETIESEQATPSLSQAQRMKKLSQSGELNEDTMLGIMSEEKKPEVDKIVLTSDTLHKYFPRSYTPKQMQDTIIKLLEQWMKKRQRSQER